MVELSNVGPAVGERNYLLREGCNISRGWCNHIDSLSASHDEGRGVHARIGRRRPYLKFLHFGRSGYYHQPRDGRICAAAMWVVMLQQSSSVEALVWVADISVFAVLLLGLTAMVRCSKRARAKGKKMKPNALLGLMYVTSSGTALSSTLSNGLQMSEHWSMANLIQAGLSAGSTDVDFVNGVMGAYGVPGLVTLAVYTVLFLVWGMLVPEVLLHSVFLAGSALGGRAVIVGSKLESAERLFMVSIALYLVTHLISSGLWAS